MPRRTYARSGALELPSIFADFAFFLAIVFAAFLSVHIIGFVDTRFGNLEVPEGYRAVPEKAGYEPVDDGEKIVSEEFLKKKERELELLKEELHDVIAHSKAMGVPSISGGKSGVVIIVDLKMDSTQRELIKRYIRDTPADKILLIGCGDRIDANSHNLLVVEPEQREAACQLLDDWPISKQSRLLDAVETALTVQGVTRIDLSLFHLPTGGTLEVLEYLKRRGDREPINCLDYSPGNVEVEKFLRAVAQLSRGTYAKGR